MKMIINMQMQKFCYKNLLVLILLSHSLAPGYSQQIQSAANSAAPQFRLEFCEAGTGTFTTCPTLSPNTEYTITTSTPTTLNADMATIQTGASTQPGTIGINSGYGQLYGVTFSGINNADIGTNGWNGSGFTIRSTTTGGYASVPLPYWMLNNPPTMVANDPDIAVGTTTGAGGIGPVHFALVVYEQGGNIWLEHYAVYFGAANATNISTWPPNPETYNIYCPSGLCAPNTTRIQLTNNGISSKPKIETWHRRIGNPSNGVATFAEYYAIAWQQEPMPGTFEIYGLDGQIFDPGGASFPTPNFPAGFPMTGFFVDNGQQPDVTAVNSTNTAIAPVNDRAFVCYLDNTSQSISVSEWIYNTQAVNNTETFNTTLSGADIYSNPRISGPMYYDYNTPSTTDPQCVVVTNEFSSGMDKVSAFKLYDPSLTSGPGYKIEKTDISDYNTTDGFSSNGQTAIMPVVSGIGSIISGLSGIPAAYNNYPVAFYSDYTNGSGADGDFYAFGIDMDRTITNPILFAGSPNKYWEVNYDPLDHGNTFNMSSKPALALATANNSGYDLLSVFYAGNNEDEVWVQLAGTANQYDFKPGKLSSVSSTAKNKYTVYPNPVTDNMHITNSDGAQYIITDVLGRVLTNGVLQHNKAVISTSSFMPGIYILKMTKDDHCEQVKFEKK